MMAASALAVFTIVAFGDSTTAVREGVEVYSEILAEELSLDAAEIKVVNAGIPKNTTRDAAGRFAKDVFEQKPDAVVIQFGLNDSAVDVWDTPPKSAPRVPLDEYVGNLESFIHQLRSRNVRVIVMTPNPMRWTPVLKDLYGKPPYKVDDPLGINVTLEPYVRAVRELATRLKVELVDVHAAFEEAESRQGQKVDDLLLDGIHPNSAGHRIVADAVLRQLREKSAR